MALSCKVSDSVKHYGSVAVLSLRLIHALEREDDVSEIIAHTIERAKFKFKIHIRAKSSLFVH